MSVPGYRNGCGALRRQVLSFFWLRRQVLECPVFFSPGRIGDGWDMQRQKRRRVLSYRSSRSLRL